MSFDTNKELKSHKKIHAAVLMLKNLTKEEIRQYTAKKIEKNEMMYDSKIKKKKSIAEKKEEAMKNYNFDYW